MAITPATNSDDLTLAQAIEQGITAPISGEFIDPAPAAVSYTPTPEEARAMFAENPGLWSVVTTEGNKLRGEC